MRFHYVAAQPGGRVTEGDLEAQGSAEVLEYLASQGLRPISLRVVKGMSDVGRAKIFGQTITVADKIFLTKYLSLMLKVGSDLFKAIDILIEDIDKPAMKALLLEIRGALEKGQPFYTTFAKYPKYFSSVFVNLIRAGESSGNLERVLNELSISLEKEQELRNKIKSAVTYPIILFVASLAMLVFLVSFALPKIAKVFMTGGMKPPAFSKIVFTVGLFVGNYLWILLPSFIVAAFVAWYGLAKTIAGRRMMRRFALHIPLISGILQKIALQRFAATLSSLLKAGLPILDSLESTADVVGVDDMRESLLRISREGIAKGLTIGEAFRREPVFPRVVSSFMAISEKAGHVESILDTLGDFYGSEVETSLKSLMTFLEPALLVGIGLVIAIIALAIIVPIYQLVGQFS